MNTTSFCKHCLGDLPENMDFLCSCTDHGNTAHKICIDCHQEKREKAVAAHVRELFENPLSRDRIEHFMKAYGTIAMSDPPRGNA